MEEFFGFKISKEMKSFLAEKKIGPSPPPPNVEVKADPDKFQRRFAPIRDPNKPENDPESIRKIPNFEWQRHLTGLKNQNIFKMSTN